MPPTQLDSAAPVAIPWFNNIWLNNTSHRRTSAQPSSTTSTSSSPASHPVPTSHHYEVTVSHQSVHSSSRQTLSSLSGAERFSFCSLPSTAPCTARQSTQDILRSLSASNSSDYPATVKIASHADHDAHLALQMRILQLSSSVNRGLVRSMGSNFAASPLRRHALPYSKTR